MQYNIGDSVVYGNFGVCIIKGLSLMTFSSDRPKEKYYILSPVSNSSSTYYVPVKKGDEALRKPLTEADITEMLNKAKALPCTWTENRQLRSDNFHATLSKGVSAELVALLNCLFQRRRFLSSQKKNLSSTDETIFSAAEKLLHEEFAYSLNIKKSEVNSYISNYFETTL